MKTKKTDWLLRVISFNKENRRIINYETLYDMSYEDVLKMAKEISSDKCVIRIYEFKYSIPLGV